jgi:hypothetical protein
LLSSTSYAKISNNDFYSKVSDFEDTVNTGLTGINIAIVVALGGSTADIAMPLMLLAYGLVGIAPSEFQSTAIGAQFTLNNFRSASMIQVKNLIENEVEINRAIVIPPDESLVIEIPVISPKKEKDYDIRMEIPYHFTSDTCSAGTCLVTQLREKLTISVASLNCCNL